VQAGDDMLAVLLPAANFIAADGGRLGGVVAGRRLSSVPGGTRASMQPRTPDIELTGLCTGEVSAGRIVGIEHSPRGQPPNPPDGWGAELAVATTKDIRCL